MPQDILVPSLYYLSHTAGIYIIYDLLLGCFNYKPTTYQLKIVSIPNVIRGVAEWYGVDTILPLQGAKRTGMKCMSEVV